VAAVRPFAVDPGLRLRRLAPPDRPVPVVLDTDTYNEIDDQFALAYALLSPERISLDAIYAAPFQNPRARDPGDGMRKSHAEILRVLERVGPHPSRVFEGSDRFLPGPATPVESPAARDLVARALERPPDEPLYVVAIAAITNVASALLLEPRIAERIVIVWLSGQPLGWPTTVEFNLCQDVAASRLIFNSGVPLVHVPCKNVAEHLRTTVPELEHHLRGHGPLASYLLDIFRDYAKDPPTWSKPLWDISAVAWVVRPAWVPTVLVHSPRLTSEYTWSHDPGRHWIRTATDVDRDAVFGDLFQKLDRHATARIA
jgi:inosine-uridine nucleoside N-ribohydrolase